MFRKADFSKEFLAPAFCFLAFRFLMLWTGVEKVSFYDELDLGTSARCMLQGAKFSFWDYQLDFYAGESLVLAAAAVPFFKFMGMNLLALKMAPFLFSFAVFGLSCFFLHRYFGQETAKKGAWLLVFCPPVFVQLSLTAMSGHTETLLWSLASTAAFYEFLFKPASKHSARAVFLFGFFGGFGAWFYYANLIMLISCLVSWALIDRKHFFSRELGIFFLGFLAGFSPWILYNAKDLLHAGDFFAFSRLGLSDQPLVRAARKILKLLFFGIPSCFAVNPVLGIPERMISLAYWLLFWVPAVLWGIKQKGKFLPLGLFPAVFLAVFMLVGFDVQPGFHFTAYRYLTPLIFWGLLLFAVLLGTLGKKANVWWAGFLVFGFLTQSAFVFKEPAGRALQYKGYSYYHAAVYWQHVLAYRIRHFDDLEALLRDFAPSERYYFYWGLSEAGVWMDEAKIFRGQISVEDFLSRHLDRDYPFLMEWAAVNSHSENEKDAGLEAGLMTEHRRVYFLRAWFDRWWRIPHLLEAPDFLKDFHPSERAWAYRSLGGHLYSAMTDNLRSFYWKDPFYFFRNDLKKQDVREALEKISKFPPREQDWIYEGMGRFRRTDGMVGNLLARPFERFFEALPPEKRPAAYRGLGWGIREIFREDAARAQDWIQALPPEGRDSALEGMREYESWYHVPVA